MEKDSARKGSDPGIRTFCSLCDAVLSVSCWMKTVQEPISIYYILQKTGEMIQLMLGFHAWGVWNKAQACGSFRLLLT